MKTVSQYNKLEICDVRTDRQTDDESMTMFRIVNNLGLEAAEDEIPETGADNDGYTQPNVVRHEDEHQHVTDCELEHVQQSLHCVRPTPSVNRASVQRCLMHMECRILVPVHASLYRSWRQETIF